MARILIASNYELSDVQQDWFKSCPNGCHDRHEFLFNSSGTFDLVCVVNWVRKPILVRAPRNQFLKLIQEPSWKGRYSHRFVEKHARYFRKVRGHSDAVRNVAPRGEEGYAFLPHQVSLTSEFEKSESVSIIASTQAQLPGQSHRNAVVNQLLERRADLQRHTYGRGRREVESKSEALDAYMYTLAIENSAIKSYFTEKVTDPILRGCVPIYFGAPNLSEYLPKGSFIQLSELTVDAIKGAFETVSREDYTSRLDALRQAQFQIAHELRLCCWLSNELAQDPMALVTRPLGTHMSEAMFRLRIWVGKLLKR